MTKKNDNNKLEIELYETKFFDYRPVSPDVATMMFTYAYGKAMETYNDMLGRSRYLHTLKGFPDMKLETMKQQKQFKILQGLRQWSDKHGMRYDMFWSWATEAHLNLGFQKTYINVFYNKKILAEIKRQHAEWTEKFLVRSDSKFFRADSYTGHPVQQEYYDYVIKGTLKRSDQAGAAKMLAELVESGEIDLKYLQTAARSAA
jgi:hypothetical protein